MSRILILDGKTFHLKVDPKENVEYVKLRIKVYAICIQFIEST